jgi:fructose-1,6-bisphosphatase/inositol monophosphatase family enzyme
MDTDGLTLLHEVADEVADAFAVVSDFGPSGVRDGQYALDLVADEAALGVLRRAGVGILSEESGFTPGTAGRGADAGTGVGGVWVVVDPIDGSTNASRGVPWFATSLCLVDADGPAVALVANQASGVRYWATRGGGAWCDGRPLHASGCADMAQAIVGVNGLPDGWPGWAQYRALGAAALDLCLVAAGTLDGYVDLAGALGPWDYLGGMLICQEAGAVVVDGDGRELLTAEHTARRRPVAAATPELLARLLQVRQALDN